MSVRVVPWRHAGSGQYQVDIRFRWPDNSKYRDRKTIDAKSLAAARRWGEARESELRAAGKPKPPEAPPPRAPKVPTAAAFAPEWMEKHHEASLHKRSGIDSAESILRCHILPFVGALPLDEISDEVIADLRAKWILGGYDNGKGGVIRPTNQRKTINNRLSVLSAMLHVAVDWRKIPEMPCRIKLLKVDNEREPAFYDHDVYERLVDAARAIDPRIYAAVLLGGDGGLRRGEILGLDLADVDFVRGRFTPQRSIYWKRKTKHEDIVKGEKAKSIPCTPRLLAALKELRHLRGARLLYTDEGTELTPKVLKNWIVRAERKAGLPPTGRLHVYRHTFVSHLAMAGVPARTIQELARHRSLSITMRYMHLSPNATSDGIAMLAASRAGGGKPVAGRGNSGATGT